ncbi:TolC family protein [Marinomonas epiphytica]
MTVNNLIKVATLCSSLLLMACSTTNEQPDYSQLASQELSQADTSLSRWQQLDETETTHYLNDLINNPNLDQLINTALAANPNLQQTLLTLKVSEWQATSILGEQKPSAEAGFSGKKTEHSSASYTADVTISWELDLWNALSTEAAIAQTSVISNQALYQASQDTLAANVMKSWLGLIAKQRAINIETKRLTLLEANEQLILKRFRNGLGDLEELDEARTSTSKSRSDLAGFKEALAIEKRTLQLYLGQSSPLELKSVSDYPALLPDLSAFAPQSLQRRPDLKVAYLAIKSADLNTQLAYKNMLPSVSLSASLSETAQSPSQALFGSPLWSLLASLTQPLYQGGQLKAAKEIAQLETAQSFQAYRDTLLTAVNEVENALGQEAVLAVQEAHTREALQSSRKNLQQYENKYRAGLVEISDLISAQTSTFDLEADLDDIIYQQLSNRITLGLALGLGVKTP